MLEIIFENKEVIVINKPAGIESVPSQNKGRSLAELLHDRCKAESIYPVHRLDRDTSGTIIFAKTENTLKQLEDLFRQRNTTKRYLAICVGVPRNREGTIRRNLSKWSGGHKPVRVIKGGKGLVAETDYQLLIANPEAGASLILFTPHQGRTHQIRVHAEALGRPIIGDHQYGDREYNRVIKELSGLKRQALHAWTLKFSGIDIKGLPAEFKADMPEDMSQTCDKLFVDWKQILEKVKL